MWQRLAYSIIHRIFDAVIVRSVVVRGGHPDHAFTKTSSWLRAMRFSSKHDLDHELSFRIEFPVGSSAKDPLRAIDKGARRCDTRCCSPPPKAVEPDNGSTARERTRTALTTSRPSAGAFFVWSRRANNSLARVTSPSAGSASGSSWKFWKTKPNVSLRIRARLVFIFFAQGDASLRIVTSRRWRVEPVRITVAMVYSAYCRKARESSRCCRREKEVNLIS